jgi:predicted phosphodiesterase
MQEGPRTFRDPLLSVYQSAVADLARQIDAERAAGPGLEAAGETPGAALEAAAEQVAVRHADRIAHGGSDTSFEQQETATLEAMTIGQNAEVCASLGLRYLRAKVFGDAATQAYIRRELEPGGKCDAKWITVLEEYAKHFGPFGARPEIPYVRPASVGPKVITIKSNARIGLIGDWGTGAVPAQRILRQVKANQPDVLIHLGDVYYSGTDDECRMNFEAIVNSVLDRATNDIPVYTLAGNHDMYSGGTGYYSLISRLNKSPMQQPASFFCLRTEDSSWQLLAMDTGQHDYNPLSVSAALTYVDQDERDWHEARIREFPGKTILLSHHQLFSAFSQIGPRDVTGKLNPVNPELKKAYDQFRGAGKTIAAWFWGHEHNLCVYEPYHDLRRGRCLGHSAIPVFVQDKPYNVPQNLTDPPGIIAAATLSHTADIYAHGFAMIALAPGEATVDYYENRNGSAVKLYSEQID